MTSNFSPDLENPKELIGGSRDDQKGDVDCVLSHPSKPKFEPKVGVNIDTPPPKKVYSNDGERQWTEFVDMGEQLFLSTAGFICVSFGLGAYWCCFRLWRYRFPDRDLPIPKAIVWIILSAFLLFYTLYIGCISVLSSVILLMRRLSEDLALKIKTLHSNFAVSAAESCCFLLLSAFFFWRLNEVVKILIVKYDPKEQLGRWLISTWPLYSVATIYSLSVAMMCTGIIRRQIISSLNRLNRSLTIT